jgi:hypothetical protein
MPALHFFECIYFNCPKSPSISDKDLSNIIQSLDKLRDTPEL